MGFLSHVNGLLYPAVFCALLGPMAEAQTENLGKVPDTSKVFIENKLKREKFRKEFIRQLLQHYDETQFETVLELNVLLYLRKSDYHGPQITDQAEAEVAEFMKLHAKDLKLAEKRYSVDRHVVASLLWIESRLGKNTGNFHVPSVYLHLIQAPRTSVQTFLMNRAPKFRSDIAPEDHREIVARTHRKARWAVEELRALERMHRWKWKIHKDLVGSFSGAFGWPQFLPSSYLKWGRSRRPADQPDLLKPQDSIYSVAFYLKDHGWRKNNPKRQMKALFDYNNSWDYAHAIQSLAERVKQGQSPAPLPRQ